MKYIFAIIIFCFGLVGCQDVKAPEKPENLIAKDKMINILTEAYLANAARSVDNKTIISKGVVIDSLVYENFGVDSLQFAQSNAYYAANVDKYIEMFQKVEARLAAMEKELDSIREVNISTKDSTTINDEKQSAGPIKDSLI